MILNNKKYLVLLLILIWTVNAWPQETIYSKDNQLDINNATLEQIRALPVSEELAQGIYERLTYRGDLKNIFDLKKIEGVTAEIFVQLKPLIRVEPFREVSSVQERIEQVYFRIDDWSSNEGTNDALIDLWIERVIEPLNVNTASYDELINLQNVSPVDVVSIINFREETGGIQSVRDMRGIPGLSYYGYSNARNFVQFNESDEEKGFHGHLTMRIDNTPFVTEEAEASQEVNLTGFGATNVFVQAPNSLPNQYFKGRFTYNNYKFGFAYNRYLGEPLYYAYDQGIKIPEMKWFAGYENLDLGPLEVRKVYAGNYSLTFGQGVIMENTDFFMPRKSGFGFRKRFKGLTGDNSRTRQYSLRGLAAEIGYQNWSAIGFVSYDDRDAILNRQINSLGERSFNQFIVLDQRFRYAPDDPNRLPGIADSSGISWIDAVNELTLGSHIQYDFSPGNWIGFTYYESAYDRLLEPEPEEITAENNWTRRQVTADSEIKQSYGGSLSRGENPLWSDAVSFRRVYGVDFQATVENFAFMGEYGELDKGGSFWKVGDDPKALVLGMYAQYPSLNFLALYRNYDVAYDNPYQRSFSNYRRFKGTIFEDYYYLQSALYGQLYSNAPQPQSEEGFYINTYYQLSREFITRIEYDNWVRKADQAKQYRLVGVLDYRPIFPISIQLRQKWQARNEENNISLSYFKNLEFRGRLRARLSNYDRLELIFVTSKTLVHPRPRVFGDIVLSADAYGAQLEHNFNNYLKLSGAMYYYKGFFWNFEDTQFTVLDSQRGALRYWLSLYARLNPFLSMRLKYTADFQRPVGSYIFPGPEQTLQPGTNDMDRLTQLRRDRQSFFYLEMSYNF